MWEPNSPQKPPTKPVSIFPLLENQLYTAITAMGLPKERAKNSPLLKCSLVKSNNTVFPYTVLDVAGDGNCGFSALSLSLIGTPAFHWRLRMMAVETLATKALRKKFY